jgi:hypothetical protein
MTRTFRNVVLGIAFGLAASSAPGQDAGQAKPEQEQVVHTIFIQNPAASVKKISVRDSRAVHTESRFGDFSPDEAHRYDIVLVRADNRDENLLVSFSSGEKLLPANQDRYWEGKVNLSAPSDAKVVRLSDLEDGKREELLEKYLEVVDDVALEPFPAPFHINRQSVPAGLADPALYTNGGKDGYSFQTWENVLNGTGATPYFRDIAGVYDASGNSRPGRKAVMEFTLRDEGVICRLEQEPDFYDSTIVTGQNACRRVEHMSGKEKAAAIQRARQVGIPLIEETLHTIVVGGDGATLAHDKTPTLTASFNHEKGRYFTGPVDSYKMFYYTRSGSRIEHICEKSFPKGTLKEGQLPVFENRAENASCDNEIVPYPIKYATKRFETHGAKSHLPEKPKAFRPRN